MGFINRKEINKMQFEKGYWNLQELEIQEWFHRKQKGFLKFDIETLQTKLIEDIKGLKTQATKEKIIKIINKRFGKK